MLFIHYPIVHSKMALLSANIIAKNRYYVKTKDYCDYLYLLVANTFETKYCKSFLQGENINVEFLFMLYLHVS